MIFYLITAITFNTIAIAVIFYLIYKKNKELKKYTDEEIEETRKRVRHISNALPKTPKEGALGYKINFIE
jgi:hypothetical protein